MVKEIQSRRQDKSISVEQYWGTRKQNRGRKNEKEYSGIKAVQLDLSARHRFKSDFQKKKNFDVNIINKIQSIQILPYSHVEDDIGSFWQDELEIQKGKVKYDIFYNFYNEIQPYSQSLPIILHNLNKIVKIIMNYLEKNNREIKKVILEMLPALIRDTQQYLYDDFCDLILVKLVEMIVITDMDILEGVYNVLAYAFKYQFDNISEKPEKFYKLYFSILFSHSNHYIRKFSSESFSYILKKMKSKNRNVIFDLVKDSLQNPEKYFSYKDEVQQKKQEQLNLLTSNDKNTEEEQEEKLKEQEENVDDEENNEEKEDQDMEIEDENQENQENQENFDENDANDDEEIEIEQNNNKIEENDKFKNTKISIAQFLFHSLQGIGFFLNQKSVDIMKHLFTYVLDSIYGQDNQQQLQKIENENWEDDMLFILEQLFYFLGKKISSRELEDKIVINFNDLFEAFQSLFTKFCQNLDSNKNYQKLYTTVAKICLKTLEAENGLKLDEKFNQNFLKIAEILIEKNDKQCIEFSECVGVYLRYLYNKEFFTKGNVDISIIQNYIMAEDQNLLSLKQAFHFVYRLVKPHKKNDIQIGAIIKNQQYLHDCYELSNNNDLVNYVLIVSINQFKKNLKNNANNDKQIDYYVYSMFYQLSIICKFQENQTQLKSKEKLVDLENIYINDLEKLVDSFIADKQDIQFVKILSLFKLYTCLQFEELMEVKLQNVFQKIYKKMNVILEFDQEKKQKYKQMWEDFVDLKNPDFYTIPEEIQKAYYLQPYNKVKELSFQDLIIIIKGELIQTFNKNGQVKQLMENEMTLLPQSKVYNNPFYLTNLQKIMKTNKITMSVEKYQNTFQCLVENLQSKYHEIRMYSLNILQNFEFENSDISKYNIDQYNVFYKQIMDLLVEVEETEANLQLERSIKMAIAKITKLIEDQLKKEEEVSQIICNMIINFFCGYAFVRFQLLWDPIKEILGQLMKLTVDSDQTFKQFMGHLKFYNWSVLQDKQAIKDKLFEVKDTEQLKVFNNQNDVEAKEFFIQIFEDDYFFEADCIDELIVYETLFNALIGCKNVVSKQRLYIQAFFSGFIEQEHDKKKKQEMQLKSILENNLKSNKSNQVQNMIDINCQLNTYSEQQGKKSYYKKLELFLKVFYQITGQKEIRKEYFYGYFIEFLQKDNEKVQTLALDNLTKYEIAGINQYKTILTNLIKKDSFKSQVTTLNSDQSSVKEIHRPEFLPVLVSILYPKLFSKRGLKHKNVVDLNRNTVFTLFSNFNQSEMHYFINLILKDYSIPECITKLKLSDLTKQGKYTEDQINQITLVPLQKLQTYLNNLKNIFDKIGLLLTPFLPQIINSVLSILQLCQETKQQLKNVTKEEIQFNTNNNSKQGIVQKLIKDTNKTGFKRLTEIFKKFDDNDNIDVACTTFLTIFKNKIAQIPQECVKSSSGVFKVFSIFAEIPEYHKYILQNINNTDESQLPLNKIIEIYAQKSLDSKVVTQVHKVFNNLLGILTEKQKLNMQAMKKEIQQNKMELEGEELQLQQYQLFGQVEIKKEQKIEVLKKYGFKILQNQIIYLKNTFSDNDMKRAKNDANCLTLMNEILQIMKTEIPEIFTDVSEEQQEILNTCLEYFIKFFEAAQSKKLYAGNKKDNNEITIQTKKQKQKQYGNKQQYAEEKLKKEKNILAYVLDITEILSQVSTKSTQYYEIIIQQLPYISDYRLKMKLLSIIQSMKPEYISQKTIDLLNQMNTYDRYLDRTLDFEAILPHYYDFNTKIIKESDNLKDLELILLNYLSNVDVDELSLKIAIQSGFQAFFEKIANNYEQLYCEDIDKIYMIRKFVLMRFLPFIQKGFKKAQNSESTMKVIVKLLDLYVYSFNKINNFDLNNSEKIAQKFFPETYNNNSKSSNNYFLDYAKLQNKTDLNQDFFEGIFDIQLQKRIKALNILNKHFEKDLITDSQNFTKFLVPLLDFVIFTKCQEIQSGNRMAVTETTRAHYQSMLQISIELYAKTIPYLSWANLKQILKKLMVFIKYKDDKTVVKLMGAIIQNLGPALNLEEDIIQHVTNEMTKNQNKIGDKSIMKQLIDHSSQQRDNKFYSKEKDEIVKDYQKDVFDEGLNLNEGEDDIQDFQADEEIANEDKIFKQMEKNALLLERQQQVQLEYEQAQLLKQNNMTIAEIQEKLQIDIQKEDGSEQLSEKERQQLEAKLQEKKQLASKHQFLKVTLLIPLKSLLFAKYSPMKMERNDERVRVHIAVALTNLCSKFSAEIFRIEFPKIISKLAKTLKDKRNEVREQSRKVLCEIARISGPYFLHYILKELKYYLSKGWEGHILNYTIFQLLSHMTQEKIPIGSIDYCLNDILPQLMPEIFGRLEEEKNLEIGKKITELKFNKAFECIHMVAKLLDFQNSIIHFVSFIKKELEINLEESKNQNKFEEMFRNSLEGFKKNPSLNQESLLIVSFTLVRDAQLIIENSRKKEYLLDTTKKLDDSRSKVEMLKYNKDQTYSIPEASARNKSMFDEIKNMKKHNMFKIGAQLSNFGLRLVLLGIKKQLFTQKIMEQNEDTAQQFEELLKLIVQCLDTSDNNMLQNALKVLKETLAWPIRFIKKHKKSIVKANLEIIQKLTVSDQDLVQDTFRLIQIVIHHFTVDQLKPAQMGALLQYIRVFSDQSDFLTEQLNTLKILIEKKFIHAEIYNIIDVVKVKMITCYNRQVQTICKQIYLQFLINYPLSDKLLQSYVNFLIKNTEYTDPHGRQIVYEILSTFLERFPEQVTNYFGEILFIALLVNQSKEQNTDILELNNNLMNILLKKLDKQKKINLMKNCFIWIKQDNFSKLKIYNSAFQGMKLFIESGEVYQSQEFQTGFEEIVKGRVQDILEKSTKILQSYKNEMKEMKEMKNNLKDSEWKEVLGASENVQTEKVLDNYNEVLQSILQFCNVLLQKNRNLVKQIFFSNNKEETNVFCLLLAQLNHPRQNIQNLTNDLVNNIFEKLYQNVKEQFLEHKEIVGKNLIPQFLKSLFIYKISHNSVILDTEFQHKLVLNSILLFLDTDSYHLTESILFNVKKISQKALSKTDQNLVVLQNILDLFLYITKHQEQEQNEVFLEFLKDEKHIEHILVPVIKLKNQQDQLQKQKTSVLEKCELVINNLKNAMDMNIFFQIYSNVKVKLQQTTNEKKSNIKDLAITDPEKLAQLKKQKNQQRYQSQKNKIKNKFKGSCPQKFIKTDQSNDQ